ncbi:MAG: hypothetical protein KI790_17690 [Cyclobacteriaceae bacterium]|nr:hypothetical protein [Cyclobacteriaceae bacterium HetDA_MAG_MS6]
MQDAWDSFRASRKEQAGDSESLILSREITKKDEETVLFHLGSALEAKILERFELDLIGHLREHLNNTVIQIEKEIREDESKKKLYTSSDKFDYMVQQNPALKDLKDKLGLDFEY